MSNLFAAGPSVDARVTQQREMSRSDSHGKVTVTSLSGSARRSSSRALMSTADKPHSLILPPPVARMNDDLLVRELNNRLPLYNVDQLSEFDPQGTADPRVLVGLGGELWLRLGF